MGAWFLRASEAVTALTSEALRTSGHSLHGDPSFDREEPRIAMQFSFLWTHLGLCAHVLGVHKIGTETERKMSLKTKNPDYVSNVRTYIRTAIIVSGSRTCGPNDGSSDSLMMATLSRKGSHQASSSCARRLFPSLRLVGTAMLGDSLC